MFWSSPSRDLNFIIISLIILFVISVAIFWKTKKIIIPILLFSLIGNLIIYGSVTFRFAKSYNVFWLFNFSRNVWPWINAGLLVVLAVNYFRNRGKNI